MPVKYKIVSDQKFVYVKATGEVTADEIMIEGARMFTDSEWINGFNILCDYRKITEFDLKSSDLSQIVEQDKNNEPLFDKSKYAIVADSDLVFGISRMWEILSENNLITTMIFRNTIDSLRWLNLEESVFQSVKDMPQQIA